jgi:hypothetical protein
MKYQRGFLQFVVPIAIAFGAVTASILGAAGNAMYHGVCNPDWVKNHPDNTICKK